MLIIIYFFKEVSKMPLINGTYVAPSRIPPTGPQRFSRDCEDYLNCHQKSNTFVLFAMAFYMTLLNKRDHSWTYRFETGSHYDVSFLLDFLTYSSETYTYITIHCDKSFRNSNEFRKFTEIVKAPGFEADLNNAFPPQNQLE